MASITSAGSGAYSAAGTWAGGAVPAGGDTATIANGHTVTVDGTFTVGNGTAASLTVNGVLKASRSVTSSLTVNGGITSTQLITSGSPAGIDYGSESDPIPLGVNATLFWNGGGTNGQFVLSLPRGQFFRAWGAAKTTWSRLSSAASVSAGSISVADATGWQVGDWLYLASTTANAAGSTDYVQISGAITGSGPYTVPVSPALSFAHAVSAPVANMTRNVVMRPANIAFSTGMLLQYHLESAANINAFMAGRYEVGYAELYCLGSSALAILAGGESMVIQGLDNRAVTVAPVKKILGVSSHAPKTGTTTSQGGGICINSIGAVTPVSLDQCVVASRGFGWAARYGARVNVTNFCVIAAVGTGGLVMDGTQGPVFSTWGPGCIGGVTAAAGVYAFICSGATLTNVDFGVNQRHLDVAFGGPLVLQGCRIGIGAGNAASANVLAWAGSGSDITISDCDIQATTRSMWHLNEINTSDSTLVKVYRSNANADDYYQVRYAYDTYADTATTYRGRRATKLMPFKANVPCVFVAAQPGALAGVAYRVIGYVRVNTAYGATAPTVALSGLGSTPATFTASGSANTWQQFDLTVTPTSAGALSLTLTCQSADVSTSAIWLDGIYNEPFSSSWRHFGTVWDALGYRTNDPRVTITEAAALALPVSVNHGTSTVTVTGAVTNAQLFQALLADLCQTANLDRTVHVTSADGLDFATSYTVTLSGAGAVAGAYTDAAGRHVTITAPALIAGSRVQVYDVTSAAELYNGVLSGAGLSIPATWVSDHTIRLRADNNTKLALQTVGLLTSAGLSFLDIQAEDTVYAALGIDGSTVTEFVADEPNIQVDATDSDGQTQWGRLYAWWQNYQTSAAGIAGNLFGRFVSTDGRTFTLDQSGLDISIRNNNTAALLISGGSLQTSDGLLPFDTSAGAGAIFGEFGRSYTALDTAAQVSELALLHGLVAATPLVVTATSRTAGAVVQTIADDAGTVTVQRV